jgi:sulfite reductase (NADPH) flavoprotein alpha-component
MNSPVRPPLSSIVPENAPFTPEQRVWLNGFFAGLLEGDTTALSPQDAQALMPGVQIGGTAEDSDGAPWHDQTMPIAERMKLAEGRPLNRRMMAAMGQQDCGQCGYNCQDYADAIFAQAEARLNLCVPGGKDTARMLKALHAEIGSAPPAAQPAAEVVEPAPAKIPSDAGYSRDNPVEATFLSRTRLNKPGSQKETWHIEFDLTGCGLEYKVGDAFGLYPHNDPALADAVIHALAAPADFPIAGRTLRDALIDGVSLSPASDMLFQLFSYITGGDRRIKAKALAAGEDPDGDADTLDVLAALEKFKGVRPDPEAFIEALEPLQPRLYSISSSPKVH